MIYPNSYPELDWIPCSRPDSFNERCKELYINTFSEGCNTCTKSKNIFVLKNNYLQIWDNTKRQYQPYHRMAVRNYLLDKRYPAKDVDYFMFGRHIHHVDGNNLNNRINNLLPILGTVHLTLISKHPKLMWELDRLITEWRYNKKLISSTWYPDKLPALESSLSGSRET